MNIQLSPTRIVPNVTTVWQEPGPEVDIVMDLRKLTFGEQFLDGIFAFHVLDHLLFEEAQTAMLSWTRCLKKKAPLFVIVDNFEFIARSFVSGDITIDDLNISHACPSHYTTDNLFSLFLNAGFPDLGIRKWLTDVPDKFKVQPFELVFSSEKI